MDYNSGLFFLSVTIVMTSRIIPGLIPAPVSMNFYFRF
jgi:hypothetical protein